MSVITKEQKESLKNDMLNSVFSNEPIKHRDNKGQVYWSDTKNDNPECLKNRVAQIQEI